MGGLFAVFLFNIDPARSEVRWIIGWRYTSSVSNSGGREITGGGV